MAETPIQTYNRLGRKKGRKQLEPYKATVDPLYRRAPEVVAARASYGRAGAASSRARGSGGGGGGGGLASSPARQQTAYDRVMEQLTDDYVQATQKQEIVTNIAQQEQELPEPGGLQGIWYDLWNNPVMEGAMSTPVGQGLYNLGRVPNATFQALEDLASRDTSVDRGFWEEGGDIWNTLAGGLNTGWNYGEGAAGGGQVYEALKENPSSLVHAPLTALEEAHPNWEQVLAVIAGAGMELGLDPYNIAGPAVPAIIRGTGRRLTRQGVTELAQTAGRQGIQDALAAIPSTMGRSPLAPDMVQARAAAAIDDALNQTVLDVAGGGAPHARTLGGDAFPSIVSQKWGQSVIDSISGQADAAVQRIINDPQAMTPGNINARRATSRDFDEFWTNLTDALKNDPNYGPALAGGGTVDEVIAILQGNASRLGNPRTIMGGLIADTWEQIRHGHYVELEPHIEAVYKAVENPTTRTMGLRVGRRVVPVPVVGRAFAFAGDKLGQLPGIKGIGSFLYEKQFPGIFANKISRASAYGVRGLDTFMRDLEKLAKGFTKEEGRELFDALGDHAFDFGGRLSSRGVSMDDALDWLRKERETRFLEELQEGARSIDTADGTRLVHKEFDPNYQYLHIKGGTKNARKAFLAGRKKQWATYGNYVGYTIADAKSQGLRPVDDAFQAAQLHYMDSAGKITNAYLWHDLAANYGLMNNATATGINDLERAARGLREVEYSKLSAAFKQATKDTGGKFYIPDEMYKMGEAFDEMMDWSTASMGRFGRSFSKVVNQFKLWTTLPYPGFHTRNFMGDTLMGMLDGVPPTRYTEIMRKYAASRAGKSAQFKIIPGIDMSFTQLIEMFKKEANSSYMKVDVGLTSTKTAGKIAGIGRTIGKKARNLSDDRELLPRFTHYVHALREEARALWNSGLRDTDVIMAQARDAALWRVNHYKFDYNALMPWERTLKSLAFPFYTYTRKAIPTLIEQMFINPHYFTMVNRWQMSQDGSAADAFNYMNLPQFWRDFGYATITDEEEPLAITGEIFPTNVLDIISSNSLGEAAGDLLATANPFIQIPIELSSGRTLYDDRPIPGNTFDYLMSKLPFVGDVQEQFSNFPGMPGTSAHPASETTDWTQWVRNRLLGGGFPLRRATEGQQAQQMETNWDAAVEDPLLQYNRSQDQFSISLREADGTFVIRNKYSDTQIGPAFATPQEAIEYALSNLRAPEHARISPLHPPTAADFAELLATQ